MDELELPSRLFETGYESTGKTKGKGARGKGTAKSKSSSISPGAVASVDDESKSSEDIIDELLDRKFSVNVESAKGVAKRPAGEVLYRGLEDKEVGAVDHLVGLVGDEYPFEHNTWTGGVKADDLKVQKGHPRATEPSDSLEYEDMDREYGQQRGGNDVVHSQEGRDQSSMRQDEAHIGGRPSSSGVADLVRQAAEAYEAQLLPVFEGYMVSMKDHISNELSKVMTAVAATNASIAAVENFVKTEFATLRKESTGVDMNDGEQFSGYSGGSPSSSQAPFFPSRQTKQGTADTRGDVQDPPQIDELDGNAATGEDDVGGSVATKGDEIVTKKTTLKPSKAGRPVRLTTVAAGDGFKRYSKRERHSPDRFTPGGVPRKQETVKRPRRGPKEKEKEKE
ncbi:hypothetical protein Bca4012_059316 [Brassica carinata]